MAEFTLPEQTLNAIALGVGVLGTCAVIFLLARYVFMPHQRRDNGHRNDVAGWGWLVWVIGCALAASGGIRHVWLELDVGNALVIAGASVVIYAALSVRQ